MDVPPLCVVELKKKVSILAILFVKVVFLMLAYKFTEDNQAQLIKAVRSGLSLTAAARLVGIDSRTLLSWIERGQSEPNSDFSDFADQLQQAHNEYWEEKAGLMENVIVKEATETTTTIDRKFKRVINLSVSERQQLNELLADDEALSAYFEKEGVLLSQEVTLKQHRPNARLALELLSRIRPEKWDPDTSQLPDDLQETLAQQGYDPAEVAARITAVLDELKPKDKQ